MQAGALGYNDPIMNKREIVATGIMIFTIAGTLLPLDVSDSNCMGGKVLYPPVLPWLPDHSDQEPEPPATQRGTPTAISSSWSVRLVSSSNLSASFV